jgi:hypothetical protein
MQSKKIEKRRVPAVSSPLPSVNGIHCSPSTSAITARAIGAVDATKKKTKRREERGKGSDPGF